LTAPDLEPPLEPDYEPGELSGRVVRGAGLASAGYVASQVLALAFFAALARLASPSDFGDLASGTLLVNFGLLFTESGMLAALIHRKDRISEAASTATVATITGGIALSLLALAASPLVGAIFHSSRVGSVAAASSGLMLVRTLVVVPEALLQRRFSFLRRAVIEPGGIVIFGIVAIALTAAGMGVWGLLLGYYASGLADVVLSWGLLRWRPRWREVSYRMWRELVSYGRWGIASNAMEGVEQQMPVVLLGRFASVAQVGQFRYAARMQSSAAAAVVHSSSYVIFPALARITHDRHRFREAAMRSLRGMAIIGMPMGLILIPLGVPAATIAFGSVWKSAGYAAMVLAGTAAAGTLISCSSEILKADGRPDLLTRVRGLTLVVAVVAMVALTPLELIGVCAGLTIGTIAGAGYALLLVRRQLELSVTGLLRQFLPSTAAALGMAAVLTPLEFLVVKAGSRGTVVGIVLVLAEAALALVLYVLFLRLFSRGHFDEMRGVMTRLLPARFRGDSPTETTAPAPSSAGPPDR
jgi:PST family polysaccharide transporter